MTDAALAEDVPLPGMPKPQERVPAATDPRIPDLEGFEIHFGIPVSSIGEDGDLLALGHHPAKQALAAVNAYSKSLGFLDLLDGGQHDTEAWQKALERVRTYWAVRLHSCEKHRADGKPVDGCGPCAEIGQVNWWVDYSATESTEGAFPVMVWTA